MPYWRLLLLVLCISGISPGIFAQISVNHVDASFDPGSREGLVYALPRTMVKLDITLEQKELLAGPLRNYAEEYLGISDYIRSNGMNYTLRDVKLSTYAEADPGQYYFVTLDEKSSKETWETIINLSGTGMISSMNTSLPDAEIPVQSLVSRSSKEEINEIFQKYAALNLFDKVDTIVRTINIDTITIEDYTFKTTTTAMPLELKAEEIARKIEKIRDDRYNLLIGYQEVNYSEATIKYMDEALQQLEQEYLRLFIGATVSKKITYSISYLPDPANLSIDMPVFRISENSGISQNGNGDQASIRIIPSGNTGGIGGGSNAGNGIYYRLPEQARIELRIGSQLVSTITATINQLGKIAVLPSGAYDVEFDENTGGLKSVKLEAQ